MIAQNLMSDGPAILPTALFVFVLALILAGFFVVALIRSAFGLFAGGSSNRGGGGVFGVFLLFSSLAVLGLYFIYQNATHLMS